MFLIAGPCAIENRDVVMHTAETLKEVCNRLNMPLFFKSSYDKANRTSLSSRGIGMAEGLKILQEVKSTFELPILTDVHESWQCAPVAEVADVLQIPAFLCRQTDLLTAAARTGRVVNIKKAQFLSGLDMEFPVQKVRESGNDNVWLTERGNIYGYNNLAVDFRNISDMHKFTDMVIMDCTHSVQRPGAAGGKTGGNREFVPAMAVAAKAFGANGYFFEVHPNPDKALSDGPNMLQLENLDLVIAKLID